VFRRLRHRCGMVRKRPIATRASAPRRPWVRPRAPRVGEPLPQSLASDLEPARPISEAELDAIDRLLGDSLRDFLAALR
jgi:hypothetical protein